MAPVNEKDPEGDNERPASTTSASTSNSTLTNGDTSTSTAASAAAPASTSTGASTATSAADPVTAKANVSSSSFLAAAAAEQRQQQLSEGSSSSSNVVPTPAAQTEEELTASSVVAISEKLQQVRGYISQTSTAMSLLEQQADMDKIGQYNTLVKVLRELKTSEAKLAAHLTTLQAASTGGVSAATPAPADAPAPAADVPNSQSIGQVSTRTVDAVDDVDSRTPSSRPSFSDRLAAGMEEANQLTTRLRDNVARREDLVERYRATRERLSALKRQRRDIQQQERTILLSQTARESPYEDPIPGAASWSLDELNTGLADFRSLYDKVATLKAAYDVKVQALEVGDAAGRAEVTNKLEQLATKRTQLIAVIAQLGRLRADKMRELGMELDSDAAGFEPSTQAADPAPSDAASSISAASSSLTAAVSSFKAASSSPTDAAFTPRGVVSPPTTATSPPTTATSSPAASSLTTATSLTTAVTSSSIAATSSPTAVTSSPTSVSASTRVAATVSSDSTSAADFSDLLPADPVSGSCGGGGSVSIGTLPALVSAANVDEPGDANEGVPGGVTESALTAVVTARAEMEAAGQELVLRTQHLNNLKEELASMKRLLDVTQRRVGQGESSQDDDLNEAEDEAGGEGEAADGEGGAEVEVATEYITGVSGNVIHLSDSERHDPAVVAKFRELTAAKHRMGQMEEIMQRISASRGTGLPLTQVLTPLQLQLLQQAEAEEGGTGAAPRPGAPAGASENVRSRDDATPTNQQRAQTMRNAATRGSDDDDEEGGEREPLSGIQREQMRRTLLGHSGDDGPGAPATAVQSGGRGTTPQQHQQRLSNIASLQEELRRKKAALEGLLMGVGQQSAPQPENQCGDPPCEDGGELRGRASRLPREDNELLNPSVASSNVPLLGTAGDVAGASAAERRSVRPKEIIRVGGTEAAAPQQAGPATDTGATRDALTEALSQLRAVQGSINSLHDHLAAGRNNQLQQVVQQPQSLQEQQSSQQQPVLQQQQQQQPMQQQHPLQQLQLLQHQLPSHSLTATPQPPFTEPLGAAVSSAVGAPATAAAAAMSGLQQCFSQLYLHSLDIQALNKQLQVRHQHQMMQLYQQQLQQQLLQQMYRSAYNPYVDPLMLPLSYLNQAPPPSSFSFASAPLALPAAPFSLPSTSLALPAAPFSLPSTSLALPSAPLALPSAPFALPSTSFALPSTSFALPSAPFALPSAPLSLPSTSLSPALSTAMPAVDAAGFTVYSGLVAPSTSTTTANASGLPSVNPPQPPY